MIKDVVVPTSRVKKNKYLRGAEVPYWEYIGVSPTYTKVDGTITYKCTVSIKDVFGKYKLINLGHFEDPLEAAKYRDSYIRENKLYAKLNFDENGNRINDRVKVSKDNRRLITSLYGILSVKELVKITGLTHTIVNKFIKDNNIEERISRNYVVIVDNRDKFEDNDD